MPLISHNLRLLRLLYRQEELKFGGQFVLAVESIGEVNASYSAVCVDLNSKCFNVVGAVGTTGEVGQIELYLIPALLQNS